MVMDYLWIQKELVNHMFYAKKLYVRKSCGTMWRGKLFTSKWFDLMWKRFVALFQESSFFGQKADLELVSAVRNESQEVTLFFVHSSTARLTLYLVASLCRVRNCWDLKIFSDGERETSQCGRQLDRSYKMQLLLTIQRKTYLAFNITQCNGNISNKEFVSSEEYFFLLKILLIYRKVFTKLVETALMFDPGRIRLEAFCAVAASFVCKKQKRTL